MDNQWPSPTSGSIFSLDLPTEKPAGLMIPVGRDVQNLGLFLQISSLAAHGLTPMVVVTVIMVVVTVVIAVVATAGIAVVVVLGWATMQRGVVESWPQGLMPMAAAVVGIEFRQVVFEVV